MICCSRAPSETLFIGNWGQESKLQSKEKAEHLQ